MPTHPTFRPFLVVLAATLLLPLALAHTSPTADEQAIMNQIADPTIAVGTCDRTSATLTLSTITYLVVIGSGSNSSATNRVYVEDADSTVFTVNKAGTVTVLAGTAHLLYHENITASGVSNAWYAWVEYTPSGAVEPHKINAEDSPGTTGDAQLLRDYSANGLVGIVGNFTTRGGGCPDPYIQGRVFDASATGGDFAATLTPINANQILAEWPTQSSAAYYHGHINTTSFFTPGPNSLRFNTTLQNATLGAFTGLFPSTTYCVRIEARSNAGALLSTSNQSCATTHQPQVTFTGNTTRVVPDNVTIYITRPNSTDYIVDCARVDPTGAVQSVCTADNWPSTDIDNNYTFRYPQSLLNTTNSYAGTYLLYVVNSTGGIVNSTPFCIQTSYSATCTSTIGPDLEADLGTDTIAEYGAILTGFSDAEAEVNEASIRTSVINTLGFAVEPSLFGVPNIAYWYAGCLLVAAFGVITRSRGA